MLVIGLTGGIGAGKSTVTQLFQERGIAIVDADVIARELVAPGEPALKQIEAHFGPSILLPDGQLNRPALRQCIFTQPDEKKWLETLLHPLIRTRMSQQIASATSPYVICDIPLLLEAENSNPLINRILVVDVPNELQVERVMERDKLSRDHILSIIASQSSREKRLQMADDVINNSGNLDQLRTQVAQLHTQYLALAGQPKI